MRSYRLIQTLIVSVGFVGVNILLASGYPETVPVISAAAAAGFASLVCMYLLPKHGNLVAGVQHVIFLVAIDSNLIFRMALHLPYEGPLIVLGLLPRQRGARRLVPAR